MNPTNIQRLLDEATTSYVADSNTRTLFVGGSVATGTAHRLSDIDLYRIVRKKTPYRRFHSGATDIEVDSFRLTDLPRRLQERPSDGYIFRTVRPLYDPERLARRVAAITQKHFDHYRVPDIEKGDWYVILSDARRKIRIAIDRRDTFRALLLATLIFEKILYAICAINGCIRPPSNLAYAVAQNGTASGRVKKLLAVAVSGSDQRRITATIALLEYCTTALFPVTKKFAKYFPIWG